jgi:protein-S-isoprenylcysteine O-methyltransferase Ste14
MKQLNFFGAGPKIGRIALPYLAISIILTLVFPHLFSFGAEAKSILFYIGLFMLAAGLIIYGITVRSLLRGLRETKLMVTGAFKYCRNPLYAVIILLIIPAVGLMMNSWLILSTCVVGYVVFKTCIKSEYDEMTAVFGDDYIRYCERTPEFFPFFK